MSAAIKEKTMPAYVLSAVVSVDVEIIITAETAEAARKTFDEGIAMSASLVDVDGMEFTVTDDCISDVEHRSIRREDRP